ncbi:AAA family ATPase [Nocardia salmonicida]|uniref:AAA family ATPase n=1 Tax=Nocardia salmonicida TaxID=53431 RepID=UPI0007A555AA|nr:AAA family ATPase [Nocardia salmonicida]
MTRYGHGLVLGKFYPPHAGHHHLVRTAAARCERLTVLVCASSVESIPLADRVAWMREMHSDPAISVVGAVDDVPMDITDPAIWDAHMAVFFAAVADPVDAVFTSEAYGDELGRRFGADAICVDPQRLRHPISATDIRRNPLAHWDFLSPPVRAAMTKRVVVLGAESTGTTTVAQALAAHYGARYVPEYGREYSERKLAALGPGGHWSDIEFTSPEFPLIAAHQQAGEDRAARETGPVLVCDTDAFATTIWHERYLGYTHPGIVAEHRQHLWLLTDHVGVAFEDDGLRDGEHLRPWMTERFRTELTRTGRRFTMLTGPPEQRLATAVAAVDALLAEGWDIADPLPERATTERACT